MTISVIIPALNEAGHIVSAILSAQNQPDGCEIIVVDGGSSDSTVTLAQSCARVLSSPPGRAVQMNLGARAATGEVLLFFHADTTLHPEAFARLRKTMENPGIAGGTFTLQFDTSSFLLRAYAFFTRFRFRYFHYGDQGIFVRRSIFERLNGFQEMPFMEDVDFLKRLGKTGRRALINRPVTTSARRFTQQGIVRQQLYNILLVLGYILGINPFVLSKWYPPPSAKKHPAEKTQ